MQSGRGNIPDEMTTVLQKQIACRRYFNQLFALFNPKLKILHVCFYIWMQSDRYETIAGETIVQAFRIDENSGIGA